MHFNCAHSRRSVCRPRRFPKILSGFSTALLLGRVQTCSIHGLGTLRSDKLSNLISRGLQTNPLGRSKVGWNKFDTTHINKIRRTHRVDSGRRDARFVSRPRLIQSPNRHYLLKAIVAFIICGALPDRAQVCVHAVHQNAHMFMKVGTLSARQLKW